MQFPPKVATPFLDAWGKAVFDTLEGGSQPTLDTMEREVVGEVGAWLREIGSGVTDARRFGTGLSKSQAANEAPDAHVILQALDSEHLSRWAHPTDSYAPRDAIMNRFSPEVTARLNSVDEHIRQLEMIAQDPERYEAKRFLSTIAASSYEGSYALATRKRFDTQIFEHGIGAAYDLSDAAQQVARELKPLGVFDELSTSMERGLVRTKHKYRD